MRLESINVAGLAIQAFSADISAEQAVRTATVDLAWPGPGFPVAVDQPVTVTTNGDKLLTGYVRDLRPSHTGRRRSLTVELVSRTVDATECSVEHPDGELRGLTLEEIGRAFDRLGIGIETDGTTFPVEPVHRLRVGETLFQTLERRARSRGVLICDTPEGKIKLAQAPEGTHAGPLGLSRITSGSATLSGQGRYSKITIRGQQSAGTEAVHMRPQAVFTDASVPRYRPLIRMHDGEATPDRLQKRAEWEAKRGAGLAADARVTVTGWRDDEGRLLTPNWLIEIDNSLLGLKGLMIIKSVRLAQDDRRGTVADVTLADPRALGGENPRGDSFAGYSAPGARRSALEIDG